MLAAADGRCMPVGSRALLEMLEEDDPDYDAALFAVRNMGFIHYRHDGALLEMTFIRATRRKARWTRSSR